MPATQIFQISGKRSYHHSLTNRASETSRGCCELGVDDIHQNIQVMGLLNKKHKENETPDVFNGNENSKKQKRHVRVFLVVLV